ncbi:MAG TPA: lipocalin-like domain-containing protein [Novosphingobium sp.]|nr:lipocalin-like domain-containing protein [Novosphingobium sp.]
MAVEQPAPDGTVQKIECPGLLTFTGDGHMALQLMQPESTANAYSHGGYEATFGTFRMTGKEQFTYHIAGSLVRDLVGKDLPRRFRITGKTLEIRSTRADEHWRVIWARD